VIGDKTWADLIQILSAFAAMGAAYFTWQSASASRKAAEQAARAVAATRAIAAADQKRNIDNLWQAFNEIAMRTENLETVGEVWFPGKKSNVIRRQYIFFMVLNILHSSYSARVHDVITDEFWISTAEDQARHMLPFRAEVEDLLERYGYEPNFTQALKAFMDKAAEAASKSQGG
jgi:hypothetical protein